MTFENKTHFMTDSVSAAPVSANSNLNDTATDSMTIDSIGPSTDWETIPIVTIDDARSAQFDTNRFHRFNTVVARPIEQEYTIDDETYTFKKPASELRKAQSSLINAPFAVGHPSSGPVTDLEQVHGFFDDVSYNNRNDALTANLYVPEDDSDAHDRLAESDNVSIGFHNQIDHTVSDRSLDGLQTDILIDHVAVVDNGRCSDEDGCQIHTDSSDGCGCGCGGQNHKYDSSVDPSIPVDQMHIEDVHPHYRNQFERACRKKAESVSDWRGFLSDRGIDVSTQADSGRSHDRSDESVGMDGTFEKSTESSHTEDESNRAINPMELSG